MAFNFNYNIFYNYYKNKSNLIKTDDIIHIKYYKNTSNGGIQMPETTILSNYYVLVGSTKIYIYQNCRIII